MNIKDRLALTFSALTSAILLVILGYTYFHAGSYSKEEFKRRLMERTRILATWKLSDNELNRDIYNKILEEQLHHFEDQQEFVISLSDTAGSKDLPAFLNRELLEETRRNGEAYYQKREDFSVAGIRYEDNGEVFLVFLGAKNSFIQSNLRDLRNTLTGLFIVYVLVVYAIGRSYANAALKPLRKIIKKIDKIDRHSLEERIEEPKTNDELWQLVSTFNNLLNRIDTSLKIQQNFISNASHELKNPLSAIIGEVDVTLAKARSNEEYRNALKVIEYEANRLNNLTIRLLQLAETTLSSSKAEIAGFRIDELIYEILSDYQKVQPGRKIQFHISAEIEDPEILVARGNSALLKMAVANIIDNALKFSGEQIELNLSLEKENLRLQITDYGIGIPQEDLQNLYIPFFRSANARAVPGFGIGLPLVKRILDMHGMKLRVESKPGEYTTFTIIFPEVEAASV